MPRKLKLYQVEHREGGTWVAKAIWETYPHLFRNFLTYYANLAGLPAKDIRIRRVREGKASFQFVGNTHVELE